eukprot:NODE_372_length_1833_cov_86.394058_g314_i0.p2 GENE.NODE_372_length_1833_cov_86.394058_g314_i0~~NODE_372_length_1833_cov_86.394058_g314_i0.p2  ORF type:complete len:287 (-),score=76.09 NODE_372_length_1833_cov_86.394058_g314_i0:85-945(-)
MVAAHVLCGVNAEYMGGYHRRDADGNIVEFEPALVAAQSAEANHAYLQVIARYADLDGGVLIDKSQWNETGLVIIKPDSLERPSSRPGHIMDRISSTGLNLVGARLFSMSVTQAEEFYGFLRKIFANKLAPNVEKVLRQRLDSAFDFEVSPDEYDVMTALLKTRHASAEVDSIIHYMTNVFPYVGMPEEQRHKRGTARCLGLLYHGPDAIATIRTKLGATDPGQAEVGTIRSDYGHDKMRNSAHASDSSEALERERHIIGFTHTRSEYSSSHKCAMRNIIDTWLQL